MNEEAPFYWQFGRGGTILLVILERRPHFIGYLREEAPFYWVNWGEGWWSFVIYVQNDAGGCLEFHFMAHALPGGLVIQMIKLFYWCGLSIKARSIIVFTQHEWNIRLWHFRLIWFEFRFVKIFQIKSHELESQRLKTC